MSDPVDKTFDFLYRTYSRVSTSIHNALPKPSAAIIEGNPEPEPALRALYHRFYNWRYRDHFLGALGLGITAYTGYITWSAYKKLVYFAPRRAKKLGDGSRKEVVLVVGDMVEPLTRHVVNDLINNKGFIVFVTKGEFSSEFFHQFVDIKHLHQFINKERLVQGKPHKLSFKGVVVLPDVYSTSGSLGQTTFTSWEEEFNKKVAQPWKLFKEGLLDLGGRVVIVNPQVPAIKYHSTEVMVCAALNAMYEALKLEYAGVVQIKLGAINIAQGNKWKTKGKPLRHLFNTVFDSLVSRGNYSVYCGGHL